MAKCRHNQVSLGVLIGKYCENTCTRRFVILVLFFMKIQIYCRCFFLPHRKLNMNRLIPPTQLSRLDGKVLLHGNKGVGRYRSNLRHALFIHRIPIEICLSVSPLDRNGTVKPNCCYIISLNMEATISALSKNYKINK